MTVEERNKALGIINDNIPTIIFEQFLEVCTQINETNRDALIQAISRLHTKGITQFYYSMNSGELENQITPIREALDLLEGWDITSYVCDREPRISWKVKLIEQGGC